MRSTSQTSVIFLSEIVLVKQVQVATENNAIDEWLQREPIEAIDDDASASAGEGGSLDVKQ